MDFSANLAAIPTPVAVIATFGIGAGQLAGPASVARDGSGHLFVVDSPTNRVIEFRYNPAISSYVRTGATVAGVGEAGPAAVGGGRGRVRRGATRGAGSSAVGGSVPDDVTAGRYCQTPACVLARPKGRAEANWC